MKETKKKHSLQYEQGQDIKMIASNVRNWEWCSKSMNMTSVSNMINAHVHDPQQNHIYSLHYEQ